jgi:hypothetical protein
VTRSLRASDLVGMPRRLAVCLLAAVTVLAGCDSSSSDARDIERFLEGKGTRHVICTEGTEGWDYTCSSSGRKIGVEVDKRGPTELSMWVPENEPLQVGPGGEGAAVRARFVDEASSVCENAASTIGRLPRPISRNDALSLLDQVIDLRRQEVIQLEAIKPPVALSPEYFLMVAALVQVVDDERVLRDAIRTRDVSTQRYALRSRAEHAGQVARSARRLNLQACADAVIPVPGFTKPR